MSVSTDRRAEAGFTLIDLLMVLVLVGILAAIVPSVVLAPISDARIEKTRSMLIQIRRAMVGDSQLRVRGARTDFGYLGDMGGLPDSISDLIDAPSGSTRFVVDSSVRFGRGWNGPYLDVSDSSLDWTKDAWGRAFIYVKGAAGSATTITSFGADGVSGGTGESADISVIIPPEATTFQIHGMVTDSGGGVFSGTGRVVLYDLDGNGGLSSPIRTTVQSNGYFTFQNVSMGRRSVVLEVPDPNPSASVGPVTLVPDSHHVIVPARHLEAP